MCHHHKDAAIRAAHRYSVILSVFDAETRAPETASGIVLTSHRGLLLVTAGHVLKRVLSLGGSGRLQIGADRFTLAGVPTSLISFSPLHDIAALRLDGPDLDAIGKEPLHFGEVASKRVAEGDLVAFVGYPGYWKRHTSENEFGLGSYEFFGPVRTVEPDQFSLLADSTYEIPPPARAPDTSRDGPGTTIETCITK